MVVLPSTILVVDDDESNRGVLYALLSRAGNHVFLAENGEAGMAVVGNPFDVAFIDIHLPDISGVEIIAALRAVSEEIFIVAATVDDSPDTMHATYAAGSDMFLVKPYDVSQIIALVEGAQRGQRWIVDRFGRREYMGPTEA